MINLKYNVYLFIMPKSIIKQVSKFDFKENRSNGKEEDKNICKLSCWSVSEYVGFCVPINYRKFVCVVRLMFKMSQHDNDNSLRILLNAFAE